MIIFRDNYITIANLDMSREGHDGHPMDNNALSAGTISYTLKISKCSSVFRSIFSPTYLLLIVWYGSSNIIKVTYVANINIWLNRVFYGNQQLGKIITN